MKRDSCRRTSRAQGLSSPALNPRPRRGLDLECTPAFPMHPGERPTMSESLHIGRLAERTGRSVHAIRWYEAQGLVPGVVRDSGGRRVYTELHVNWLQLM